ncbi:UDP binding domain-containing protein [Streptomyces niveus]|uniref:UDP binding domain-containing protein n=1 Tax=Streptomyces niveus TaxID=193462 RepID=UPI003F542451
MRPGLGFGGGCLPNDIRDSPALAAAQKLQKLGAEVTVTDPQARDNARKAHPDLDYVDGVSLRRQLARAPPDPLLGQRCGQDVFGAHPGDGLGGSGVCCTDRRLPGGARLGRCSGCCVGVHVVSPVGERAARCSAAQPGHTCGVPGAGSCAAARRSLRSLCAPDE